MKVCVAVLILAFAARTGPDLPRAPLSVRDSIVHIHRESNTLASKNPALSHLNQRIERDLLWLHNKLTRDEPLEYRMQLTLDAYVLTKALTDSVQAEQIMTDVEKDLRLKSTDCRRFGHGRAVRVEVETIRGDKQESGWQICYLWVPTVKLAPIEMHFPRPSSPAVADLPPGQYIIHAERKDDHGKNVKSESVTVPVGGTEQIHWKLLIP
jgi:hypothetical protein